MPVTITIKDETTTGDVYSEVPLEFPSEQITVRELIRERVYQEVTDFNHGQGNVFKGLVQPTDTERVLNGKQSEFHLKTTRQINWKEQYEHALNAFEKNGFFILIDNLQAESLDQQVTVKPSTEVSFVRLTMLVGG